MKTLKVERFDAKYVYCTDTDKNAFAIELQEAPSGLKAGNILTIDDDGNITVSEKK